MATSCHSDLKEAVCWANLELVRLGLVLFTWGNASQVNRAAGVMAIKPSGIPYDSMKPEDMAIVRLSDGQAVEGNLKPSSDTPTHLALYRAFESVGGVVHTHSPAATAWAQACRDLPCFGTTHADHFHGAVPCTACLTAQEIQGDYECATGEAIVRRFREAAIDPLHAPAALVANHGPFAWGKNAAEAAVNARVLEECARMALDTLALSPNQPPIAPVLLGKHFLRKHGPGAYYGQRR
ncbi:MAG: L-ribulose-5-phosphate 4-epimerase AraD [Candidatus Sumerlaeota bacterium]|nr:L-ribulose-5-phosphate 4-epimerase AraD [Candidatus Sumerlaeota bacterium]